MGDCTMSIVELEVEIAWLEKDLNNAEQNDNPEMVKNLTVQLEKLYEQLKTAKEKE